MRVRGFVACAAVLGALGLSTPALAGGWEVELVATVKTACHADLKKQLVPDRGVVDLGPLREACNGVNGFQVYAITPPGTGGAFVVDGQSIPVASDGRTQIDATEGAVMTTRQLSYDPQGGESPKRVTITVVINW